MTVSLSNISDREIREMARRIPRAFSRTSREKLTTAVAWAVAVLFLAYAFVAVDFSLVRIWNGLGKLGMVVAWMIPPSDGGWLWEFVGALFETVAMAFLGTLIASIVSVPLGFLGAKNLLPSWFFHFGLRRVFDGLRGVDALIWALIFVNVVGLGPFAGILALAVSDTGTLSKLSSEAIENVDNKPVDGLRASGANRLQVMRYAIFPQVLPVMLSNSLYYFESNTRSATILGIVGAGGIGLHLADRIRVNNWDEVGFLIIMILVTVAVIDLVSRWIRQRVIHSK